MIKKLMGCLLLFLLLSLPTLQMMAYAENTPRDTGDISGVMEKMYLGQPVTIVSYGDSVTYGDIGGSQAKKPYPEALQQLLRSKYKNNKITVLNKGSNGRKSDEALKDFDSWVVANHPDLVIIMYGINDASGLVGSSTSVGDFKKNLSAMVDKANANKISTLLMTPTPTFFSYEYATPEINKKMLLYNQAVKEVANEKKVNTYDLFNSIYNLYYSKVISNTNANSHDGVHFTSEFYQVIASDILYHALDYTGMSNTLLDRGKNDTNIPLVYSPFIDTDFIGVNSAKNQFYVNNYFVNNDGSNGKYLKFDFYMDTPGMDLILTSPKSEYGGKVAVYDNGDKVGTVDFYNKSIKFDVNSIVLKNISVGKHSLLFSIDNLVQGTSKKSSFLMYFTAFRFTESARITN